MIHTREGMRPEGPYQMKKISTTAGFAEALVKRWRWHQSSWKRAPDESCWDHWAPQNLALSTIFMDKINTACPFLPNILSRIFGGWGFLWCSLFYPTPLRSQLLHFTASVRITIMMVLFCIVHKEKSTNLKLKVKSQQVEWKTANNYRRLSIFERFSGSFIKKTPVAVQGFVLDDTGRVRSKCSSGH